MRRIVGKVVTEHPRMVRIVILMPACLLGICLLVQPPGHALLAADERAADERAAGRRAADARSREADALPADASPADALPEEDLSEEEQQQVRTAERFFGILEKNPRRGTALDRVYGHHVEFGTLAAFLQTLKQRTEITADDGAAWMLLGMLEAHRGQDGDAVEALVQAESLRPDDPLASYYLGQSQLRIGQSEEAVASMERALNRKPQRSDLLEIFQQLGRVHQRAQRTDEALKVWERLEALFPDDPRVLEQIAVTLAEEGQPALALPRYERLAELVKDDYRKVTFQMAAAELRIKTGERDAGIQSLENVLNTLNPESWLYRDVRRRIEDVFLRSGDQDRLVKYYETWLERHPEDVEGMTRLARFLAASARVPEAAQWMEKALRLAPSRTELRKAFIDQLVNDQRIPEAIEQYAQLVASAPSNPDFLREWGKLVLRHPQMPDAERRREAAGIWNRMLQHAPDDALTTSQVADLFRQNKMPEQAEALYRKAIELAPQDPQYREYLGEFLHVQDRSDEAMQVWAAIATEPRRNVTNITRLAEVYNSFGFPEKAVTEIAEAVRLDPKDFSLQIRAADYHSRAEQHSKALEYVDAAERLAANDDERDAVIGQRIEVLQTSQQLEQEADRLSNELRDRPDAALSDWYLLARYLEAGRRWPDATDAVNAALRLDPQSIPVLTLGARIAETSGDYGHAAATNRRLAEIDRRSRGDHLMNVARLEAQLGRAEEALQAAQDLIVSAPGNTDHYEFYAQLCFRLGRSADGLETLRKAVRINPNEPHLIMALGAALAEQLRTDEAIEVYWRAFEKSEEVEDKVGLTMKLTPLYQQVNQLDQLIQRFELGRQEEDQRREMTICLAQAWHSSGDLNAARQELESLLSEDTRDTNLLNQLAKLCQEAADLDAAVEYQRQLTVIAPGHETEFPLAGMLMSNGQQDEAQEILVRLTQREEDPVRQLRSVDSLLTRGSYETVIEVVDTLLAQNRDDWELLYREGTAWALLEKPEEARNRFERILSLNLPFDSLGRSAEAQLKQQQAKAKSDNLRGIQTTVPQRKSPLSMRNMSAPVQRATGLTADNSYYPPGQTPPIWTPDAFGVARMAAFGWLMRFENDEQELARSSAARHDNPSDDATATSPDSQPTDVQPTLFERMRERADSETASREAIYDLLYVAQLNNDYRTVFNIARRLAAEQGKEEQQFFLSSLKLRHLQDGQSLRGSANAAASNRTPLSDEDLLLAQQCYDALSKDQQTDVETLYGGNVAYSSNGQVYVLMGSSYTMLPGVFRGEAGYLTPLVEELRLAGRTEQADALLNDRLQQAQSTTELIGAIGILLQEKRDTEIPEYFERWVQAAEKQIAEAPVTAIQNSSRARSSAQSAAQSAVVLSSAQVTLQRWLGRLGAQEENPQVLAVLEPLLNLATAEARHRLLVKNASPGRKASVVSGSSQASIQWYYGEDSTRASVTFPPHSDLIDRTSITLLRQVYEVLNRNQVAEDLTGQLRQRVTDSPDELRHFNQLYLASCLWWIDEQDEAVELMAAVAEQFPENLSLQFDLARMYESRSQFEDALTIIENISPRDQQVLYQRELMALQLAERLGDIDRARHAAERLFGLRLNADVQLQLVDRMRRLGLNELADAILARAERTATNQTSSLASMMLLYQGQGKSDQANQLAHMLLRKTPSPLSVSSRMSRNPMRYNSVENNQRQQALQQLQRSGGLKPVIDQLETQLQRSPDSIHLLEQLIEFYGVSGQKDAAMQRLEQAVTSRPDAAILRLQLAKLLEQSGKFDEACEHYLKLLKQHPRWITEDLSQVERIFTQAKRRLDLVNALADINMKSISNPGYIINTASRLMQDEEHLDVAMKLMERAFEAFPQYRQSLVRNFQGEHIWKNKTVYQFAKKALLPSALDIQSSAWTGLDQINSYSGNGEVNVFFHQVLTGLKSSDQLADLEASIQDLVTRNPTWRGGTVMLALIELNTQRKDLARQRLEKLIADSEAMDSIPYEACWVIGQELDRFEETRDDAMMLYEKAMGKSSQNSMNQLQYSPTSKLIDAYARTGRKQEARDLLLRQLKGGSTDIYDVSYASYQKLENTSWVAGKLLELEYPVDAVQLYQQMLADTSSMATASQYSGRNAEQYSDSIREGMEKAMTSVDSSRSEEVIGQLLSVSPTADSDKPVLELMLSIPPPAELAEEAIRSSFVDLLVSLSTTPSVTQAIGTRLHVLSTDYPADLSIAVATAAWKLRTQQPDAADAVQQLLQLSARHPLEQIAAGRRPSFPQRKAAAARIPVWLIARECFTRGDLVDEAGQLAEVAREAASRQLGTAEQSAILYDWGKTLLHAGNREEAEKRWTELLEISTQRPQRKAAPATPATGHWRPLNPDRPILTSALIFPGFQEIASPDESSTTGPAKTEPQQLIPPLTLSQFRTVVLVAQSAAENGMSELSRKAVSEALKGGFPVADPVPGELSAPTRIISSRSMMNDARADPIELEVVQSLTAIIAQWQGDAYPPLETYQLLKSLVFPENRPAEIRMYFSPSDLMMGEFRCLAEPMVEAAAKADRLADLLTALQQRSTPGTSVIPSAVLKLLVALQQSAYPTATEQLTLLNEQLKQGVSSSDVQMACMAALRAFRHQELRDAAFPILQSSLQQAMQNTSNNLNSDSSLTGMLPTLINRYLAARGNPQAVAEYFETVLRSRQSYYARYGGDYGMYQQWKDLGELANQSAKLGMTALSIDFMGRACDIDLPNYQSPSMPTALKVACRHGQTLSAADRYEFWHQWTMPAENRQTLRFLAEVITPADVPEHVPAESSKTAWTFPISLLSNFDELVSAARDAECLPQLIAEVAALDQQQMPQAEFLQTLALIALGDLSEGAPRVRKLQDSFTQRMKPDENRNSSRRRPTPVADYLVYRACLQSETFAGLAENRLAVFRRQLPSASSSQLRTLINYDWLNRKNSPSDTQLISQAGHLKHWIATSQSDFGDEWLPWWTTQDDQLVHLAGNDISWLQFRYPLTGSFSVSMDCYQDTLAGCGAGYAGIAVLSPNYSTSSTITTASGHEVLDRPGAFLRTPPTFNRVTIEVDGNQMQYLLNGYLVYQETISHTSPWLVLTTQGNHIGAVRNLQFSGDAVIPQSVSLLDGDRMDGWVTTAFDESQPSRRQLAEHESEENGLFPRERQSEPEQYDWSTENNILTARADSTADAAAQSWIYYHRPLLENETFEYDFYYVPGQTTVHPTLGRTACLIQPDGVQTHHITPPADDGSQFFGTPETSAASSDDQPGAMTVPLKADDWNHVRVTRTGNTAAISLNDTVVFECPLTTAGHVRFGLFRYRNQTATVRNIRLSGDWPKQLDSTLTTDLLAASSPLSSSATKEIAVILDDAMIAPLAGEVVMQARSLPSEQAYDYLADWVLPSRNHNNLRLYYSLASPESSTVAPADQSSGAVNQQSTTAGSALDRAAATLQQNVLPPDGSMQHVLSPAIELVRLAAQLGKLETLTQLVNSYATDDALQQRDLAALRALIALESGDEAATRQALQEVWKLVEAGIPKETTPRDRSAEFIVAWRIARDAVFWPVADDITRRLRDYERAAETRSDDDQFNRHVHGLLGDIERIARTAPSVPVTTSNGGLTSVAASNSHSSPAVRQWTAVPYLKPELTAKGYQPSEWLAARGSVQQMPGETWSQLFFQSPLRGKFEVVAEHSTHGHKEVSIGWGMHSAEPRYDLKAVRVTRIMHGTEDIDQNVSLPQWDQQADFRILVNHNTVTTFTNGVKIHEQSFHDPPDPWLVIQAAGAGNYAKVNNLRILGDPEIPEEIDLIRMAGLSAWRADIYGEWFTEDKDKSAPWQRQDDEITGQLSETAAEYRESLLLYQRPMLEDGVIQFSTWYEAGKFEVAPALGPDAFLLRPDGVYQHQMTAAQYEQSSLSSGNETAVPSSLKDVPLKSGEWNDIRLSLKGSQLTISVNDTDVAEVTVTVPPRNRQFGLFRFSNKTECRVKNLVYRGDWPRQLPPVEQQELAGSPDDAVTVAPDIAPFDPPLNQSTKAFTDQGLAILGPADQLVPQPDGLHVSAHNCNGYSTWPGLVRRQVINGDLDVILDYRDLRLTPAKEGWGLTSGLEIALDDPQKSRVECGVSLNASGQMVFKTMRFRNTVDDKSKGADQLVLSTAPASGRLRLLRQGGQVHCLAAEQGSEDFRLLASYAVGGAAVRAVTVSNKCSDAVAAIDVILERLQIRSVQPDQFPPGS